MLSLSNPLPRSGLLRPSLHKVRSLIPAHGTLPGSPRTSLGITTGIFWSCLVISRPTCRQKWLCPAYYGRCGSHNMLCHLEEEEEAGGCWNRGDQRQDGCTSHHFYKAWVKSVASKLSGLEQCTDKCQTPRAIEERSTRSEARNGKSQESGSPL